MSHSPSPVGIADPEGAVRVRRSRHGAGRPAPGGEGRDPYFDNAKLLLIVLVVCGHLWEPLVRQSGSRALHALYDVLYTFHMPVFVFVSGYFSRSFTGRPGQLRRLVSGIVVPYLVFNALLGAAVDALTRREISPVSLDPLIPVWVLWFLAALFLWRLTAPIWAQLRAPLAIAVTLSVAAGAFPLGAGFAAARTVQFLPFFVAGLVVTPERLYALRSARWLRPVAVPVFALAGVGAYWAVPRLPLNWLYRSQDAAELHVSYAHWAVQSLALNAVGTVLGVLFLALVPRGRSWITPLGAASMSAYLLHPFLQRTLLYRHVYRAGFLHHPAGQTLLTLGAVLLALVLCSPPVHRIARPLTEPRLRRLFRPDADDGPAG